MINFNVKFSHLLNNAMVDAASREHKLTIFKVLMTNKLPFCVITELERLNNLKQELRERLEVFVERFLLESQVSEPSVTEDEVKRILFTKLPLATRALYVNLEPSCSAQNHINHLRNVYFCNGLDNGRPFLLVQNETSKRGLYRRGLPIWNQIQGNTT